MQPSQGHSSPPKRRLRSFCQPIFFAALIPLSGYTQTLLVGGGATFPYPIYARWISEYQKLHPDVEIQYDALGSGAGIKEITAGVFDFAGSDAPMDDAELNEYRAKRGVGILHFPTVIGADVPIHNIPGVNVELKFTPEVLVGIYLGEITRWNDQALTKVNPDANLPNREIVVAYRSDGSGTTYIWTDYLSKVSEKWDSEIGFGTTVPWPVGVGGHGNNGVAGLVKQTPYSIGYVELAYAISNKLTQGRVQNKEREFVKASLESVTAAAAEYAQDMPESFRVSITDAPGRLAYPISSFTWLLVPEKLNDKNKLASLRDFLKWALTDGQKLTDELMYAPLPAAVIAREEKILSMLQ